MIQVKELGVRIAEWAGWLNMVDERIVRSFLKVDQVASTIENASMDRGRLKDDQCRETEVTLQSLNLTAEESGLLENVLRKLTQRETSDEREKQISVKSEQIRRAGARRRRSRIRLSPLLRESTQSSYDQADVLQEDFSEINGDPELRALVSASMWPGPSGSPVVSGSQIGFWCARYEDQASMAHLHYEISGNSSRPSGVYLFHNESGSIAEETAMSVGLPLFVERGVGAYYWSSLNWRSLAVPLADPFVWHIRTQAPRGDDYHIRVFASDFSAGRVNSADFHTHSGRANVRVDLRGADLRKVGLRGYPLRECDLRGADIRNVDLSQVNLEGADLRGADLRGANLEGANLKTADLRGADLRGAKLEGAQLEGCIFQGADLTDCTGVPETMAT